MNEAIYFRQNPRFEIDGIPLYFTVQDENATRPSWSEYARPEDWEPVQIQPAEGPLFKNSKLLVVGAKADTLRAILQEFLGDDATFSVFPAGNMQIEITRRRTQDMGDESDLREQVRSLVEAANGTADKISVLFLDS
jgi:hypothetical protein